MRQSTLNKLLNLAPTYALVLCCLNGCVDPQSANPPQAPTPEKREESSVQLPFEGTNWKGIITSVMVTGYVRLGGAAIRDRTGITARPGNKLVVVRGTLTPLKTQSDATWDKIDFPMVGDKHRDALIIRGIATLITTDGAHQIQGFIHDETKVTGKTWLEVYVVSQRLQQAAQVSMVFGVPETVNEGTLRFDGGGEVKISLASGAAR